jgi:hypothetical protein
VFVAAVLDDGEQMMKERFREWISALPSRFK